MTLAPIAYPRRPGEPLRRISVGASTVHPLVQLHYRVDPSRFFPQIGGWPIDAGIVQP